MAKFTVKIKGLDQLKKKLNAKGQKDLVNDIRNEFKLAAKNIASLARSYAIVNNGLLRNSIEFESTSTLGFSIYSKASYAPYVEFGTKTKVQVPADMQDIALQFKNSKQDRGNWQEFKENIKNWIKQKGIVPQINGRNAVNPDQQDWDDMYFLIMMSIYKNGISPKPFLYPAFKEGTKDLQKQIDNVINLYLNK